MSDVLSLCCSIFLLLIEEYSRNLCCFLFLKVLAWGNSMPDLSGNVTTACKGLANMAMHVLRNQCSVFLSDWVMGLEFCEMLHNAI